jgi:hypothetical protein
MKSRSRPGDVKKVLELAVGYQKAMILFAANRLGLFQALGEGPQEASAVAARCHSHPRSTEMLLNACVALGLLVKEGGRYRNSPLADRYLVAGRDAYLGHYLSLLEDGYQKWGQLAEAVAENRRVSSPSRESGQDRDWNRRFTLAMHEGARTMARQVARALDLRGCQRLLDVGGGPGTFTIELVRRNPGLEGTIFDLPGVLEVTQELVAAAGLDKRVRLQPGDYHTDSFGQGNDVVLLFGILHSEGHANRKMLLTKAFDSLVPGGLVVLRQFLLDEDRAGPVEATTFSLQMLLYTDSGEAYSWGEIQALLKEAGFMEPTRRLISPQRPYWLVIAHKPQDG